jgi:hypothetical protein
MTKIYILVKAVNDYNQYGEYYLKAYKHYPTLEDIAKFGYNEIGREGQVGDEWVEVVEDNLG